MIESSGGGGLTQADLDAAILTRQLSDADLTDIAALVTTAFGRGLLTLADAAALLSAAGAAAASHSHTVSALSDATTDGKALLQQTNYAAMLTALGAAASVHDHDSDYSAIGHDHDADYAPISVTGDPWTQVRRTTGGTAVNNSTTPVADTVLKFTPAAGTVQVVGKLRVTCFNATAGIQITLTNSPTNLAGVAFRGSSLTTVACFSSQILGVGGVAPIWIHFDVTFDCSASEYAIGMAQNTAQVGDNTINAGSYIRWRQVATT